MTEEDKLNVSKLGQAIRDIRAKHNTQSLSDLYDPDFMPNDIRKAHSALDRAVDRLYRTKPFASERERVEHLFETYEKRAAPLAPKPKAVKATKEKPQRTRKRKVAAE